jgi:hypothetical protein
VICTSSSTPVSGIISLKGQVMGCQALLTKVSLVVQALTK